MRRFLVRVIKVFGSAITAIVAWLAAQILLFGFLFFFVVPLLMILNVGPSFRLPFRLPFPGVCISETVGKPSEVGGLFFEVVDMNCDVFAKDESITLFVSKGLGLVDWFGRRAIFKYAGHADLSSMSVDRGILRISANAISSVYFAKDRWKDVRIIYDISSISYPSASDPKPSR